LETGVTKACLVNMTVPVHSCEKCCMGYEYTHHMFAMPCSVWTTNWKPCLWIRRFWGLS